MHCTFDLRSILALVWRNLDGTDVWLSSSFLLFLLAKFMAKFWLFKFLFLFIGHLFYSLNLWLNSGWLNFYL